MPIARMLVAVLTLLVAVLPARGAPLRERPALVLFITVDQLRGDMLPRFEHRFGADGFRALLDRGVHYTNAHFAHSTTFTSVGHATLFTGGNAPEHGIVGNVWGDETGRRVYSVEDARYRVHGEPVTAHRGTGPGLLIGSTIGDELVRASAGRSRVFAVSIKDRGAIFAAGHLGRAIWYSSSTGRFVTSTAYFREEPAWLSAWNDARPGEAWRGKTWSLLRPAGEYERADRDDRGFETAYGSLGRTFPHPLDDHPRGRYHKAICYTPFGDELTVDLVETLIAREGIGGGDATDLLSVSLSCTDYIGHAFGPNSLEAEDNLLRLDRTIARLLAVVERAVGLERTIVVLSADHGIDAAPEHHHELLNAWAAPEESAHVNHGEDGFWQLGPAPADLENCCETGRHYPDKLLEMANEAVREAFGVEDRLVLAFFNPCIYLDRPRMRELGLDPGTVEAVVAETIEDQPGIAEAVTRSAIMSGRLPDTPLMHRVRRAFHPRRSGDVLLIQLPSWALYHNPTANAAMHGSPYAYDTHVPIVVAAPGMTPATVHRPVAPRDIAPTLATLLRIPRPSGCVGEPLEEVVGGGR